MSRLDDIKERLADCRAHPARVVMTTPSEDLWGDIEYLIRLAEIGVQYEADSFSVE